MSKKYVKVYCPQSKCHGLVTIEKNNGVDQVVNFYEIDNDTANKIKTDYEGNLPMVSQHLKPCADTGRREPKCCDKKRSCKVKTGELWYQCLYCSNLELARESSGGAEFYFLLDASGSMSDRDREEASKAVSKMMQSLQGNGNTYSFVPWACRATYLFHRETNLYKMNSALSQYENDLCDVGGSTAADEAFEFIYSDVMSAKKPVRIILVTDGYFNDDVSAVRARDSLLRKKDVEILAIGITGANASTLKRIGTVPAFSKVVGGSSALTSTFEEIAQLLKNNGNNF